MNILKKVMAVVVVAAIVILVLLLRRTSTITEKTDKSKESFQNRAAEAGIDLDEFR